MRIEYKITLFNAILQIKDKRYEDVIDCISNLGEASNTRAGLSLMGYCYYHSQKYEQAATCYEQLSNLLPKVPEYKYVVAKQ